MAIPNADPICRAVLCVPEPWPLHNGSGHIAVSERRDAEQAEIQDRHLSRAVSPGFDEHETTSAAKPSKKATATGDSVHGQVQSATVKVSADVSHP
jgi:hypothetical protein